MPDTTQALVIVAEDEESAARLNAEFSAQQSPGRILKRDNLDGSAATWMVVATTALTVLPKILDSLAKVIEALKVRSIKIGDKEIRNPTAADIRALRKSFEQADD